MMVYDVVNSWFIWNYSTWNYLLNCCHVFKNVEQFQEFDHLAILRSRNLHSKCVDC